MLTLDTQYLTIDFTNTFSDEDENKYITFTLKYNTTKYAGNLRLELFCLRMPLVVYFF